MRMCPFLGWTWLFFQVAGSCAEAQAPLPPQPIALHVGGEFRRLDREECALKAVEAMGVKEKFILAEIDKDGNAWGYNEQSVVRVFTVSYKDGVSLAVVVAGADNKEAERLRNEIRTHIAEGAVNRQTPKQIKTTDTDRKPCPLQLRWSIEQRSAIPVARFLLPIAAVVMEKNGLGTNNGGGNMMFGGNGQSAAVAFGLLGPNDVNINFACVAVSADEHEAERLSNVIRAGIVKVLYD